MHKVIEAIIFDMDGTLFDSERLHFWAYQSVLEQHGVKFTEEQYNHFTGMTDLLIANAVIERYGLSVLPDALISMKEQAFFRMLEQCDVKLLPGVVETLDAVRALNLKLAVASSSMRQTIESVLKILKIHEQFHSIAAGDEVTNSKPAPDIYLLAADRLGVSPAACIAFEDSQNGVNAATSAGIYCVAIPQSSTARQDFSLSSLKLSRMDEVDLQTIIQRV